MGSLNPKLSVIVFQKSSFIYNFLYKSDACYISRTTQRLDVRMNQHIPSNICTNTLDYTAVLNNQNSSSAFACHLLDTPTCTTAYNPTMFTILETSSYKLHLSILEVFLITKYQPTLCIHKKFYTLLLFNNPIVPWEENTVTHTNSSGLW